MHKDALRMIADDHIPKFKLSIRYKKAVYQDRRHWFFWTRKEFVEYTYEFIDVPVSVKKIITEEGKTTYELYDVEIDVQLISADLIISYEAWQAIRKRVVSYVSPLDTIRLTYSLSWDLND